MLSKFNLPKCPKSHVPQPFGGTLTSPISPQSPSTYRSPRFPWPSSTDSMYHPTSPFPSTSQQHPSIFTWPNSSLSLTSLISPVSLTSPTSPISTRSLLSWISGSTASCTSMTSPTPRVPLSHFRTPSSSKRTFRIVSKIRTSLCTRLCNSSTSEPTATPDRISEFVEVVDAGCGPLKYLYQNNLSNPITAGHVKRPAGTIDKKHLYLASIRSINDSGTNID